MENALHSQQSKMLPTTYKEALIQLLEQVEQNEKLVEENKILLPKAEYCEEVLHNESMITTTVIANDLGMTAQHLNKILYANGIQWKQNKTWVLTKDYMWMIDKGYCDYKSYDKKHSKPSLQWSELGRKYIIENIKVYEEIFNK